MCLNTNCIRAWQFHTYQLQKQNWQILPTGVFVIIKDSHNRLTWYQLSHSYWCATYDSAVRQISRYSLPMIVWWIWLITLITCTKHHYKSHTAVFAGQMCHKLKKCAGNVHHSGIRRCARYIFITFTRVLGIMVHCNDTVVMGKFISGTGLLNIIYWAGNCCRYGSCGTDRCAENSSPPWYSQVC